MEKIAPIASFQERLIYAMRERNMNQVELSRRSGVSKARISQYVSGKFEAKQDGVALLSIALNVNEAWLMGYDCPMDRCTTKTKKDNDFTINIEEQQLLNYFKLLNDEGRDFLLSNAKYASEQERYMKNPRLEKQA